MSASRTAQRSCSSRSDSPRRSRNASRWHTARMSVHRSRHRSRSRPARRPSRWPAPACISRRRRSHLCSHSRPRSGYRPRSAGRTGRHNRRPSPSRCAPDRCTSAQRCATRKARCRMTPRIRNGVRSGRSCGDRARRGHIPSRRPHCRPGRRSDRVCNEPPSRSSACRNAPGAPGSACAGAWGPIARTPHPDAITQPPPAFRRCAQAPCAAKSDPRPAPAQTRRNGCRAPPRHRQKTLAAR
jgi:hypothetical protein